jgi:hypothetical protein
MFSIDNREGELAKLGSGLEVGRRVEEGEWGSKGGRGTGR